MSRMERWTQFTLAGNNANGEVSKSTKNSPLDMIIVVLMEAMIVLCIASVYTNMQISLARGKSNQINQPNPGNETVGESKSNKSNEELEWNNENFTVILNAFIRETPKAEEDSKQVQERAQVVQAEQVKKVNQIVNSKKEAVEKKAYTIKGMKSVYQLPELPTGCEATALTILLNHQGINAGKWEIAMKYMPRQDFYYKNGETYGPNPENTFVGDPSRNSGLGCFAPCLVQTVWNYLRDHEEITSDYIILNLNGKEFSQILQDYVGNDIPVVVIVSQNLSRPRSAGGWRLASGGYWNWMANHHAMVVYGFDIEKDEVLVCDPLRVDGFYKYRLSEFEEIYNLKGKSAMSVISANG